MRWDMSTASSTICSVVEKMQTIGATETAWAMPEQGWMTPGKGGKANPDLASFPALVAPVGAAAASDKTWSSKLPKEAPAGAVAASTDKTWSSELPKEAPAGEAVASTRKTKSTQKAPAGKSKRAQEAPAGKSKRTQKEGEASARGSRRSGRANGSSSDVDEDPSWRAIARALAQEDASYASGGAGAKPSGGKASRGSDEAEEERKQNQRKEGRDGGRRGAKHGTHVPPPPEKDFDEYIPTTARGMKTLEKHLRETKEAAERSEDPVTVKTGEVDPKFQAQMANALRQESSTKTSKLRDAHAVGEEKAKLMREIDAARQDVPYLNDTSLTTSGKREEIRGSEMGKWAELFLTMHGPEDLERELPALIKAAKRADKSKYLAGLCRAAEEFLRECQSFISQTSFRLVNAVLALEKIAGVPPDEISHEEWDAQMAERHSQAMRLIKGEAGSSSPSHSAEVLTKVDRLDAIVRSCQDKLRQSRMPTRGHSHKTVAAMPVLKADEKLPIVAAAAGTTAIGYLRRIVEGLVPHSPSISLDLYILTNYGVSPSAIGEALKGSSDPNAEQLNLITSYLIDVLGLEATPEELVIAANVATRSGRPIPTRIMPKVAFEAWQRAKMREAQVLKTEVGSIWEPLYAKYKTDVRAWLGRVWEEQTGQKVSLTSNAPLNAGRIVRLVKGATRYGSNPASVSAVLPEVEVLEGSTGLSALLREELVKLGPNPSLSDLRRKVDATCQRVGVKIQRDRRETMEDRRLRIPDGIYLLRGCEAYAAGKAFQAMQAFEKSRDPSRSWELLTSAHARYMMLPALPSPPSASTSTPSCSTPASEEGVEAFRGDVPIEKYVPLSSVIQDLSQAVLSIGKGVHSVIFGCEPEAGMFVPAMAVATAVILKPTSSLYILCKERGLGMEVADNIVRKVRNFLLQVFSLDAHPGLSEHDIQGQIAAGLVGLKKDVTEYLLYDLQMPSHLLFAEAARSADNVHVTPRTMEKHVSSLLMSSLPAKPTNKSGWAYVSPLTHMVDGTTTILALGGHSLPEASTLLENAVGVLIYEALLHNFHNKHDSLTPDMIRVIGDLPCHDFLRQVSDIVGSPDLSAMLYRLYTESKTRQISGGGVAKVLIALLSRESQTSVIAPIWEQEIDGGRSGTFVRFVEGKLAGGQETLYYAPSHVKERPAPLLFTQTYALCEEEEKKSMLIGHAKSLFQNAYLRGGQPPGSLKAYMIHLEFRFLEIIRGQISAVIPPAIALLLFQSCLQAINFPPCGTIYDSIVDRPWEDKRHKPTEEERAARAASAAESMARKKEEIWTLSVFLDAFDGAISSLSSRLARQVVGKRGRIHGYAAGARKQADRWNTVLEARAAAIRVRKSMDSITRACAFVGDCDPEAPGTIHGRFTIFLETWLRKLARLARNAADGQTMSSLVEGNDKDCQAWAVAKGLSTLIPDASLPEGDKSGAWKGYFDALWRSSRYLTKASDERGFAFPVLDLIPAQITDENGKWETLQIASGRLFPKPLAVDMALSREVLGNIKGLQSIIEPLDDLFRASFSSQLEPAGEDRWISKEDLEKLEKHALLQVGDAAVSSKADLQERVSLLRERRKERDLLEKQIASLERLVEHLPDSITEGEEERATLERELVAPGLSRAMRARIERELKDNTARAERNAVTLSNASHNLSAARERLTSLSQEIKELREDIATRERAADHPDPETVDLVHLDQEVREIEAKGRIHPDLCLFLHTVLQVAKDVMDSVPGNRILAGKSPIGSAKAAIRAVLPTLDVAVGMFPPLPLSEDSLVAVKSGVNRGINVALDVPGLTKRLMAKRPGTTPLQREAAQAVAEEAVSAIGVLAMPETERFCRSMLELLAAKREEKTVSDEILRPLEELAQSSICLGAIIRAAGKPFERSQDFLAAKVVRRCAVGNTTYSLSVTRIQRGVEEAMSVLLESEPETAPQKINVAEEEAQQDEDDASGTPVDSYLDFY